jgi:hypothetical protein
VGWSLKCGEGEELRFYCLSFLGEKEKAQERAFDRK